MKITQKSKGKTTWIAVLCLIGMLALVGGSVSIYTNEANQRGVVRNQDNEVVRFSSNYMQACAGGSKESDYAGRIVSFTEEQKSENSLPIEIEVYNYVLGNKKLVNQRDIRYTMTISIGALGGTLNADDYSVQSNGNNAKFISDNRSLTWTQTATLIGRTPSLHTYTVNIPGTAIDNVQIVATAVPTDLSVTNDQMLAAVIRPATAAKTAEFTASGTFIDKNNGTPADYAGFNYLVSISSGKASATLTWADSLEVDKYFLEKIGKNENDIKSILNARTVTFEMNQPEGTGEYLIPFYIKNKDAIQKMSWDDMENLITFSATKQEEGTSAS